MSGWHLGNIGTGWPNRRCQDGIRERLGQDGQTEDVRMASGKGWPNRRCQDGIRERLGQDGQIEDVRIASGKDWDRMAK